jgi:DNA invertase Pin-like site-specific DNA recombinase
MIAHAKKPVAYAYVRVSTEDQKRGDGPRRQEEGARDYATEKGLSLTEDRIIRDIGYSAYTGQHIRKGNLGRLLRDVKAGKLERGTHLIVESLDRLSRQNLFEASDINNAFLRAGIIVHTWSDRHVYDPEKYDIGNYVKAGAENYRANSETKMKINRQNGTWEGKRANATRAPLTARCPAWLELPHLPRRGEKERGFIPTERKFTKNKQRCRIVEKIFKYSAAGFGNYLIVTKLNNANIAPFGGGKGWAVSSIAQILNNRAVLGEFQPCHMVNGKREPIGEPIKDYYPPIISADLFERAHYSRDQRKFQGEKRGRPYGGRKGSGVGQHMSNLLSGLIKCAYCGSPVHYINKGTGYTYLFCHNARHGNGCVVRVGWRYHDFERWFINNLTNIDWAGLIKEGAENQHDRELEGKRVALLGRKATVKAKIDRTFKMPDIPIVAERLLELQKELDAVDVELASIESEIATTQRDLLNFNRANGEFKELLIDKPQNYDRRVEIAFKLKTMIEAIYIAPAGWRKNMVHNIGDEKVYGHRLSAWFDGWDDDDMPDISDRDIEDIMADKDNDINDMDKYDIREEVEKAIKRTKNSRIVGVQFKITEKFFPWLYIFPYLGSASYARHLEKVSQKLQRLRNDRIA